MERSEYILTIIEIFVLSNNISRYLKGRKFSRINNIRRRIFLFLRLFMYKNESGKYVD